MVVKTLMICLIVAASRIACAACPASSEKALRAIDQSLLDAYAPGDRTTWDHVLAPDAVIVDENGAIMERADFLKSITPLPANTSGTIAIVDYRLHLDRDTALVIHRDDERENYHGIKLRAAYLTSETWVCRRREWKLSMVHAYVQAKDPPPMPMAAVKLKEYVGRYEAAPDLIWTIGLDGDRLTGRRAGGKADALLVEAPDVLFIAGQPRDRRIFQRDADGGICGYIQRREGEDIIWKKVQ